MTKTIKIVLILIGLFILGAIKLAFKSNGSEGGIIWAISAMAYIAYVRAIWRYEKKSDDNKLDKTIK
ncbi:MAG: hypothetical protein KA734_06825 [Fluviicola sp.]|nr:hypothetical protein [Fluviicola sp.]